MTAAVAERSFIDTWVRSDAPARGYGAVVPLNVQGGTASTRVVYLQTAMPCPAGATVVSAKLRLVQYGTASAGNRTLSLRRVTARWSESMLWKNRPGRVTAVSASSTVTGAGAGGRVVEFDVTSDVQMWVNGAANYGWALESSAAQLIRFYSKDAAANRPQLIVEWTSSPERPTSLQPTGGLFTSTPRPMVRWNYADRGSQIQALTRLRVQVKATNSGWSVVNGYSAPDFDSGAVAATVPQLDLAATAYPGLAAGGTAWHTVQHQDASGLWSQWSDPQQFGYQPAPSVTLAAPSATVNDTAFTVAWSTATQERYRVIVTNPATGGVLWDTGEQTSPTVRDVQVPRGILTRLGQRVTVIVRTWDGYPRATAPGAPTYAQAVRTLTYSDTTAVAPVADLEVVEAADAPASRITWRRAAGSTVATQFGIWVDDVETLVVDADDAADPARGADAYAAYVAVPAGTKRRIAVKAIEASTVDGITQTRASANSPTVEHDRVLFGVWLTVPGDPSRDIRLLQDDDEIVETSMPEVTARFDPVGSPTAVHVTTALRWFEGTVTDGILADYGTLTAEELRRRMLLAKSDRLTIYTLMWGTHAVPVHVYNVDVAGDWIPGATRYAVSFDFTSAVASPEYELR